MDPIAIIGSGPASRACSAAATLLFLPLGLAALGCATQPEALPSAPTTPPMEAPVHGMQELPGHGDVLWGGDTAANVTALLGLLAGTVGYVDGPEYGRFRVQVTEEALQERVLEQLRQARGGGDHKVWLVEFHAPGPEAGGEGPVVRTEELR